MVLSVVGTLVIAVLISGALRQLLANMGSDSLILQNNLATGALMIWWLPVAAIAFWLTLPWFPAVWSRTKDWILGCSDHQWTAGIFTLSLALTGLIAYWGYGAMPKTGDEVSLLFQAKIFASGRWFAPAPSLPQLFHLQTTIIDKGKWFSMYQPGHPLILALGSLAGLPWLIGPLLASATAAVSSRLFLELSDRLTARFSSALLLSSPFFLLSGSSFLVHGSSQLFLIFSLWMAVRSFAKKRWAWLLLAGAGAGFGFITRSYTTVAFWFPIVVLAAYLTVRQKLPLTAWVWFILGFIPFLAFQLWNNRLLTGQPLLFPYFMMEPAGYNAIGFGRHIGGYLYGGQGHTPVKGLINLGYTAYALSLNLLGWPFLSLIPIGFLIASGRWKKFALVSAVCASLFLAYFFYWYNGIGFWGPRFYIEIIPLLIFLSIAGLRSLKNVAGFSRSNLLPTYFAAVILSLGTVTLYLPYQWHFLGHSAWGCKSIPGPPSIPSLVLVPRLDDSIPGAQTANLFLYPSFFNGNPLLLDGDVIYARQTPDISATDIARNYPGRTIYSLAYNKSLVQYTIIYQPDKKYH